MPRFRGARRGTARRTNWIAQRGGFVGGTLAVGATGSTTVFDMGSHTELSKYVSPTLVRMRGIVLIDWDMAATGAGNNGQAIAAIHVGANSLSGLAASDLSSDDIVWTDMCGVSHDTAQISGTESNDLIEAYTWEHQRLVVDVKAQRILTERHTIQLLVTNLSITNAVPLAFSYYLRCLFKE